MGKAKSPLNSACDKPEEATGDGTRWGKQMSHVPPQRATGAVLACPEEIIDRLSRDLERAISLAEECRWHFPELSEDADRLAAEAMALFSKSLRALQARSSAEERLADAG